LARAFSIFWATDYGKKIGLVNEILKGRTYLDEAGVGSPAINNTPFDFRVKFSGFALSEQLVQAASGRTTAILRVLGECYSPFDAVGFHFACSFGSHWPNVSECDIRLVRGGRRVQLVKKAGHTFSLEPSVAKNRRAASDIGILLLNLRGPPLGNVGCKETLEWKRYKVAVKKEIFEKIVGFWDLETRQ
jgi:hypothetical protein